MKRIGNRDRVIEGSPTELRADDAAAPGRKLPPVNPSFRHLLESPLLVGLPRGAADISRIAGVALRAQRASSGCETAA